jgi:hypothetical protein
MGLGPWISASLDIFFLDLAGRVVGSFIDLSYAFCRARKLISMAAVISTSMMKDMMGCAHNHQLVREC